MDAHTLELLGFDKLRTLLATYTASSLGRDLAQQIDPSQLTPTAIRKEISLTSEMVEAIGLNQSPPFAGLK